MALVTNGNDIQNAFMAFSSKTVHTSVGGNVVNRWVFKKYADSPFFYSKIGGVTETEQGWYAVGIIVEIYGEPLQAV